MKLIYVFNRKRIFIARPFTGKEDHYIVIGELYNENYATEAFKEELKKQE